MYFKQVADFRSMCSAPAADPDGDGQGLALLRDDGTVSFQFVHVKAKQLQYCIPPLHDGLLPVHLLLPPVPLLLELTTNGFQVPEPLLPCTDA